MRQRFDAVEVRCDVCDGVVDEAIADLPAWSAADTSIIAVLPTHVLEPCGHTGSFTSRGLTRTYPAAT